MLAARLAAALLCLSPAFPATAADEMPSVRFLKLDAGRAPLPPGATRWECVLDQASGLTWEAKTDDGLRGRVSTYTWFDPAARPPGKQNGGVCRGSACDTAAYVAAINAGRLCGHDDWRLPQDSELFTLFVGPGIVHSIFAQDGVRASYWSATEGPDGTAVFVAFYGRGISYHHGKAQAKRVRLVRGTPPGF